MRFRAVIMGASVMWRPRGVHHQPEQRIRMAATLRRLGLLSRMLPMALL